MEGLKIGGIYRTPQPRAAERGVGEGVEAVAACCRFSWVAAPVSVRIRMLHCALC